MYSANLLKTVLSNSLPGSPFSSNSQISLIKLLGLKMLWTFCSNDSITQYNLLFRRGSLLDDSVQTVWTFNGKKGYIFTGYGPSLKNARSNHACSIFRSEAHNGNPVIVVAGGKSQKNKLFVFSCKVFSP